MEAEHKAYLQDYSPTDAGPPAHRRESARHEGLRIGEGRAACLRFTPLGDEPRAVGERERFEGDILRSKANSAYAEIDLLRIHQRDFQFCLSVSVSLLLSARDVDHLEQQVEPHVCPPQADRLLQVRRA